MTTVADICAFLDDFAPPALAAEWDNVGLLVGDRARKLERLMTCLTVTPRSPWKRSGNVSILSSRTIRCPLSRSSD